MEKQTGPPRRVAGIQVLVILLGMAGLGCVMMSKMSWRSSTNPHAGSSQSIAEGAALYARECASCHGIAGFGDGEAGKRLVKPPTNLRRFIAERSDGYFASQVAHGKTGNTEMPVFVETLSEDEIWHVTHYVYSLGPVPSIAPETKAGSSNSQAE
jgi:mono/diheme cytochrome c family protein